MERQSSIIFIQSKIRAANTPERIKKSISIFVTTQQMKIQNGTRMTLIERIFTDLTIT